MSRVLGACIAIGLTATMTLLVGGCGQVPAAPAGPGPGPSVMPTASTESDGPTPTPTPTPSRTPPTVGTPAVGTPAVAVGFDCAAFLPADQVGQSSGHLLFGGPASPAPGTPAAAAVGAGGIACRVIRESSGAEMIVAVASPGSAALAEQTAAASSMELIDAGPPVVRGDSSNAFLFVGDYVLSATQAGFGPGGAAEVLRIGAANLP